MDQHHWEVDHHLPSKRQRIRDARKDVATGDLFAAPSTQSETSQEAAAALTPDYLKKLCGQVQAIYDSAGPEGYARFQAAAVLGREQSELSSTIVALLKRGSLFETTRKIQNPRTRQNCFVLVSKKHVHLLPPAIVKGRVA